MSDNKLKRIWFILIIAIMMIGWIFYLESTGDSSSVDSSNAVMEEASSESDTTEEAFSLPVIYFLDGGRNNWDNPTKVNSLFQLQHLGVPYRFGYEFQGWYLDPDYIFPVNDMIRISENRKQIFLYAKWDYQIDNRYNVENYHYTASKKIQKDTVRLKDTDYSFIEDLKIPGMPSTIHDAGLNSFIYSEDQNPQGLCLTSEYYFISSYSEDEEIMGELLVFDRNTGELLVTLGMDENSHLGGIAFDGENVWVCNSAKKTVERISYDFIQLMANVNSGQVIDARDVVDSFKVSNRPSCITYYGGRLWIATHTKILNSHVVSYYFNENTNKLTKLSSFQIPARVQGISFDSEGKVYLSTSFGRTISSYLLIYRSAISMSDKPDRPEFRVEMPPCSEEIHVDSDMLYAIFESAGYKYYSGTDGKGSSTCPLDKVLTISLDSLIYEEN